MTIGTIRTLKKAILSRHSVRSYDNTPLETQLINKLTSFASEALNLCKAEGVRIAIINDTTGLASKATYGFIAGCTTYMVLISSDNSRHTRIRAAAAMELCVLYATSLGLGTCWIGGTFRRSSFSDSAVITAREEILAIVPVGISSKPRLRDRIVKAVSRSHTRKDPSMLFFDNSATTPLNPDSQLYDALQYVRLAPSSTNSQPWRIIAVDDSTFDLCAATDNSFTDLDMGIAVAHLTVAFGPENIEFSTPPASYPRLISFYRCKTLRPNP